MVELSDAIRNIIGSQRPRGLARWRAEPGGPYTIYSNYHYYHLNETAGRIYSLLDGKNTIDDVVATLKQDYPDVDGERLYRDVVYQIRALERNNVVRRFAENAMSTAG